MVGKAKNWSLPEGWDESDLVQDWLSRIKRKKIYRRELGNFLEWIQLTPEELIEKREETLENEVRPSLKQDGGDIELVDVIGNRVLVAKLGTCAVCKASHQTLKNFVELKLRELVWPELEVEEVPS